MTPTRIRLLAHLACGILAAVTLIGCREFPSDFASRPLDDKIATYERWLLHFGRERREARAWISWHGVPAADAMAPYLDGRKGEFLKYEALYIIWFVQLRGCSLRGTAAEQALSDYLSAEQAPTTSGLRHAETVRLAETVLEAIRRDRHVADVDGLPPGPCSVQ